MGTQLVKAFFNHQGKYPHLPNAPTSEEILDELDVSPLNDVIVSKQNEGNMDILRLFAINAFKDPYHSCRGMSFAIYASSGQGKTYIVKQWAKTIGIPFVFVQADALSSTWNLLQLIVTAFKKTSIDIVDNDGHIKIPPCIVFIDEAHALPKKLMEGGLLNAMEYNDGIMKVTRGKGKNLETLVVDCSYICWVGATTEEGKLFDAFASRLETNINWHPAGPAEIAQIVGLHYPHFPQNACEAVAHYRNIPRAAMAFARLMNMTVNAKHCSWEEAASEVATNMGIDSHGMPKRQVKILEALGQRPIAKGNLSMVAGCKPDALENIVLPPLMSHAGNGPFIVPTHRGFMLTRAGLYELDKRGLDHNGDEVTVEAMEEAVK